METVVKTAEDKIRRGIINLQKPQPFFAYLLMMMKPQKMGEDMPMQTMGVDAKGNLFYGEEWLAELNEREIEGTLCHETLHVALMHMARTGSRNRQIANIAQDVVVNGMVLRSGLKLPKGTIPYDNYHDRSQFQLSKTTIRIDKVGDKAWEEVYAEIMDQLKQNNDEPPKNPRGNGQGGLGFDDHIESDMSEQEQREQQQKWQGAVAEAANYAKQQGKLPGGMERFIDDLLKPQVKWKQMLLKYLRPFMMPVDWSYQRPHKKSQVLDVFMPNTLKEHTEVEVVVDTSGSIAKKELTEFLSEIVSIAKSVNHVKMHVNFVDTKVCARYEVENGDIPKILSMEPKGGGGTSMECGLDYIKKNNSQVPVVVVFTDGYDSWDKKGSDYPFDVIWVITKGGINEKQMRGIPYGSTIKMD